MRHVSVNIIGPYHLEKGIECQDSYYCKDLSNRVVIAAVADGLGSEKYSKIGSEIASRVAVEYIASLYSSNMKPEKVKRLINNSFVYAYRSVLEAAEEMEESHDEFDTTLCLAILDNQHLYYGQSGDSGMIALLRDGAYINVVRPQNDEDGNVFPLCCGPKVWEFGEIEEPVISVMLMTDGIYARLVNTLIKYEERSFGKRHIEVNVPFAEMLMRRTEHTDEEVNELQEQLISFFDRYPKEKIDDDKTLVLIFDPDNPAGRMPDEYYRPADYDALYQKALKEMHQRLGYDIDAETSEMSESKCINDEKPFDTSIVDKESGVHQQNSFTRANEDQTKYKTVGKRYTDPDIKVGMEKEAHTSGSGPPQFRKELGRYANEKQSYSPNTTTTCYRNSTSDRKQLVLADNNQILLNVIVIAIVMLFGIVAFLATDLIKQYASVTYLSIVLICFFSNATVLLPAPSTFIVIEYACLLNPLLVAVCGGLGAALGEMTGFLVGSHSKQIFSKTATKKTCMSRMLRWIEVKFSKHPYIVLLIFSIIPLPLFDVIGIIAGAVKLKPIKFLIVTFIGKTIKMVLYVTALSGIIPLNAEGYN